MSIIYLRSIIRSTLVLHTMIFCINKVSEAVLCVNVLYLHPFIFLKPIYLIFKRSMNNEIVLRMHNDYK